MTKNFLCQYCGATNPGDFYASKGRKTCKKCAILRAKTDSCSPGSHDGRSMPPSEDLQIRKHEVFSDQIRELRESVENLEQRAESLDTEAVHASLPTGPTFREKIERELGETRLRFEKMEKDTRKACQDRGLEVLETVLSNVTKVFVHKDILKREIDKKDKEIAELRETVEDLKDSVKGVVEFLWDCIREKKIIDDAIPRTPRRSPSPVPSSPKKIPSVVSAPTFGVPHPTFGVPLPMPVFGVPPSKPIFGVPRFARG